MYKELFLKYEGTYIGNHSDVVKNFNNIRAINMANALGRCPRGNIEIEGITCFIDVPLNYSSFGKYIFRPIYYGEELYSHLYTKGELIKEGYSLEEAEKRKGYYKFMRKCHSITLFWLQEAGEIRSDIRAITSLSRTVDDKYFFHSYICYYSKKMGMDMVADFSQNIIMPKIQYDELMLEKELNVLTYTEYLESIDNSDYDSECGLAELLYLGLVELKKDEKQKKLINN